MEQKTEASQAVKFRKKPVEIEAIQWTGKLSCLDAFNIPELHQSLGSDKVGIPTLEGTMIAHVGDWVIKGVKGEFYPCKPDIFELTYVRAALKAQPAPTEAPNFCACCGKRLHAGSIRTCTPPGATEAAQGGFLVRVTPMNPEYVDVHPELALEDALRVNPYGWPDGFQFEVVAAQSNTSNNSSSSQLSGNSGELAQGVSSARLDALEKLRQLAQSVGEDGLWNTAGDMHDAIDILAAIDRARASAETGGVKP